MNDIQFILNGKTVSYAGSAADRLLDVLREAIPEQPGLDIQLCVEVLEIDREPYAKERLPG